MPRTGLSAEEIRDKAVEITLEQMRRVGFERVRLKDVAAGLGVSHAALYAHFSDKAALLDAVTAFWLNQISDALEDVCRGPGSPAERIESWVVERYRLKRDHAQQDQALYHAYDVAALRDRDVVVTYLETLDRQLTGLMTEAGLPDPAAAARMMREATIGYAHPRLVSERLDQDLEPVLRELTHVILAGLIERAAGAG